MVRIVTAFILGIPAAFLLFRSFREAGAGVPGKDNGEDKNRNGEQLEDKKAEGGRVAWKSIAALFAAALFIRLLGYGISYLLMVDQSAWKIAGSGGADSVGDAFRQAFASVTPDTFFQGWMRWDAVHYINIAKDSYWGVIEDGQYLMLVFFPLYPYLLRLFSVVIENQALAGMAVSSLSFAGGICYLYCFANREYGARAARIAVCLLTLFPFSFFYGGIMTESLFFLTSVASLYYLRSHRYLPAALWGMAASMTRMHGILLVAALLVEIAVEEKVLSVRFWKERSSGERGRVLLKAAGAACVMSLGLLYYLLMNAWTTGNPFQFRIYQKEHWSQGPGLVTDTLQYLFHYASARPLGNSQIFLWIPEVLLFFFAALVLWYGVKRCSISLMVYFFTYFLLNYSVTWLLSAGRYMSAAVPMFLVLAVFCRKRRWLAHVCYLVFGLGQLFFLTAFLWGQSVM